MKSFTDSKINHSRQPVSLREPALDDKKKIMKIACPFCKPNNESKRGEGCCNCDHTGLVPIGEAYHFKTQHEAINHDPEVSYVDLKFNRENGLPLNRDPFKPK